MKKFNLLLIAGVFVVSMSGVAAHATETVAEKVAALQADITTDRDALPADAAAVASARTAVQASLGVYESSKTADNKKAEAADLKALNAAYSTELNGHKPKGEALVPGYAQLIGHEASLLTVYTNHKKDYDSDIATLKAQIKTDKASKKDVADQKTIDNHSYTAKKDPGFTIPA